MGSRHSVTLAFMYGSIDSTKSLVPHYNRSNFLPHPLASNAGYNRDLPHPSPPIEWTLTHSHTPWASAPHGPSRFSVVSHRLFVLGEAFCSPKLSNLTPFKIQLSAPRRFPGPLPGLPITAYMHPSPPAVGSSIHFFPKLRRPSKF